MSSQLHLEGLWFARVKILGGKTVIVPDSASMPSPSEAAARRAGIGAAATSAKTKSVAKSKVADKTKCTAKATLKPSINVLVKKSTTRTMPKNCVVDAAVETAEEAELAVKTERQLHPNAVS